METRPLQLAKALLGIDVSPDDKVIFVSLLQFENALLAMLVTVEGMT
jgi:hypothetical protein